MIWPRWRSRREPHPNATRLVRVGVVDIREPLTHPRRVHGLLSVGIPADLALATVLRDDDDPERLATSLDHRHIKKCAHEAQDLPVRPPPKRGHTQTTDAASELRRARLSGLATHSAELEEQADHPLQGCSRSRRAGTGCSAVR